MRNRVFRNIYVKCWLWYTKFHWNSSESVDVNHSTNFSVTDPPPANHWITVYLKLTLVWATQSSLIFWCTFLVTGVHESEIKVEMHRCQNSRFHKKLTCQLASGIISLKCTLPSINRCFSSSCFLSACHRKVKSRKSPRSYKS